ncbi:lactate dehydrogenase related dehydrogenase [Liquorilactobacillus mali KCTC 3596 = DSM 20444]|nr:lactate dehydrogenase related dehydrogenase [Liquorilactobacillus mali KCTC 3596 = DSM 20444]
MFDMQLVYVVDPIADDGIILLKEKGFDVFCLPKSKSVAESLESIVPAKVTAIIIRATKITPSELESFPNLKIIARHGVGIDNLPLDYIKKNKIRLTYTPGLNAMSVAELALTLMLDLLKKIPVNRKDNFYDGELLAGKTIGLIGYGKIAQKLSLVLRPFGVDLLVYNHRPKQLTYGTQVGLDEIAKNSDDISLHIPATPGTNRIIDKSFFNKMKPNAFLINTARGALVDSDSLYSALTEHKIAGAALDVLDSGEFHSSEEFQTLKNLILTPHIGASSLEVLQQSSLRCAKEILLFKNGEPPIQSYF